MMSERLPTVRFAAVGLNHLHIFTQVASLMQAGATFAAFYAAEEDLASMFVGLYPQATRARELAEILEDESIPLVTSAAIPDERAALAVEAMRHGKDVLIDKPGAIRLEEVELLRKVQAETGRRWIVYFSERVENAATVHAAQLVRDGAIGKPVQTIGVGPHQLGLAIRPDWFFDRGRSGGILTDLASHQIDQFLHFTRSSTAEITAAHVANHAHPEHPSFDDFGEVLLRSEQATGYARVDWYTPAGLGTWGDVRLTVLGTEGFIEVRKNCDLAGRDGGDHLFIVDGEGTRHIPCAGEPSHFAGQVLGDVIRRTAEAMPQEHAFVATELAIRAQMAAMRVRTL